MACTITKSDSPMEKNVEDEMGTGLIKREISNNERTMVRQANL